MCDSESVSTTCHSKWITELILLLSKLIDIFQMRDKNILQNRCDLLGPVVKFLRCFNVIIVQYVSSDGI